MLESTKTLVISSMSDTVVGLEDLISEISDIMKDNLENTYIVIREDKLDLCKWVEKKGLKVILVEQPNFSIEYIDTLYETIKEEDFSYMVANSNRENNEIITRLATRFDAGVINDVRSCEIIDHGIHCEKPAFGEGLHCECVFNASHKYFITFKTNSEKKIREGSSLIKRIKSKKRQIYMEGLSLLSEEPRIPTDLPQLESAEIVVCIGNGIKDKIEFGLAVEYAKSIDAAIGCTRPIVERGFMSKEYQIGQSGILVKPKVYIGLGISGATQHIVGCTSPVMIAINNDQKARIFDIADYGLIMSIRDFLDQVLN
ncbi:MAG: electron transfer flavoprotein subunit alpha/FixB family protein [Tissierellia bacterium]|nr:electron transfer flavoprotein subunit alpha/FixB family protein [Tissierellia bacterium]